jgi:hypothetical protein
MSMGSHCVSSADANAPIVHPPDDIWLWTATVKSYWKEKTEELGDKPVPVHSVLHKSHMDWPGRKLGLRGERSETNRLSHGTAYKLY